MFKINGDYPGYPPIEGVVAVPVSLAALTWDLNFPVAISDPVWGAGEAVFARAGGSIPLAALCTLTPVWDAANKVMQQNMIVAPNTANLGRPGYVYLGATAITVGQYGWFMTSGTYPVSGTATVAADTAVGITAAGQVGAITAGKQLLNARVVTPATQTVVAAQSGYGANADTTIGLASVQGFFPGAYVSGTGVGAAAIVASVDPIGKSIVVTVANSAQVAGNVTATYNNAVIFYNVLTMNRLGLQGAIT